jgi:tetratricopeptide (TPR) repeat protein
MASIFLSYARSDSAKARTIASLLERAGHNVWWDRFIRGGSQYSREIEKELTSADVVVVLWSADSVESAWVRDEAAVGRDTARLVPVTIDGSEPPLGFRQFQTIDLARRRIDRHRRVELLSAIDGLAGVVAPAGKADAAGLPARSRSLGPASGRIAKMAGIAILVIAIAAAILWQTRDPGNRAPLVAVTAIEPGAAAGSLASDLLVKLGVIQSSHADALQLIDANSRRKPDFLIRVGSVSPGSAAQAHLLLVDNRAGTLLWSEEFNAPSGKPADLRQQMAYSAAKVLDCAVQAAAAKVDLDTLKLYLSGCANLSNLLATDPKSAVEIFGKVTERAPRFEGAWKKLILADIRTLRVSGRDNAIARQTLEQRIAKARQFHPEMSEIYLAEAWLLPARPLSGWINRIEQGLAKDPDNPEILAYESLVKANVGRMRESLASMRQAVKSDPLSSSARDLLITALLNSGQADEARHELKSMEQLWPGASNVLQARFAIEFRVGDASEALKLMRSGQLGPGFTPKSPRAWMAHEGYLRARMSPTPTNKRLAIVNARAFYAQDSIASWVVARALSEFGSLEELIAFLESSDARVPPDTIWTLFRTTFAPLHRDRRFMRVAARFGLVDYWSESGKWPDFCADPGLGYDCRVEAAKVRR